MFIKKIKLDLKCDTDGCDRAVEREIYLNGEYAQIRLCAECAEKLYDALADEFCNKKGGGKRDEKADRQKAR